MKQQPSYSMRRESTLGMTLTEVLISVGLMAFLLLGMNMYITSTFSRMTTLENHSKSTLEIEHALGDMRNWLNNGSIISSQSTNQELILDTLDENNNVVRVIYQIVASKGHNVLEVSYDNGTTWISPYMTGGINTYNVNSGEFLYCGYQNNCTRFMTAGGLGTLVPPGDSAFAPSGSTALISPNLATKVMLYNFSFTRLTGLNQPLRTISNAFVRLGSGQPIISYVANDLQYFNTSMVPGSTSPGSTSILYDPGGDRLLLGLYNQILLTTSTGQYISYGSNTGFTSPVAFTGSFSPFSMALAKDHQTLLMLNQGTGDQLYLLNLNTGAFGGPVYDLDTLGFIQALSVGAIAYDLSTPNDFYVVGTDTGTGAIRIYARQISSGAAATDQSPNYWDLPPAAASSAKGKTGLTIEPASGDFYISQNNSSGNVRIYHINRSSPTTDDHFDISLSGSSTTSTTANIPSNTLGAGNRFPISYDPLNNHIFMDDVKMDRIFEILPPRIISPRS